MPHLFATSEFLIVFIFVVGYLGIIFEHKTGVNKATYALLMAVGCWAVQFLRLGTEDANILALNEHLAEVSQVCFFLMGALTIVETIHVHGGLNMITRFMRVSSKVKTLWIVGIVAFFLSSILDNLTTTIVMVTMLKKIVKDYDDRLIFGAAVVIAANAGGAWTPIGDVTTTMLWIGGQVTTLKIMHNLFLPSFISLCAALACFSIQLHGSQKMEMAQEQEQYSPYGKLIFFLGLGALIFVPIFKILTGLPPFMGMLFSLGVLWFVTDVLHHHHSERQHLRVLSILTHIDFSAILFFLGILLSIDALATSGLLKAAASGLDRAFASKDVVAILIGALSAIIDNVPLTAACMGMYNLQQFVADGTFWQLVAFAVGTGGSMLIIGSAAGVGFMSIEKVDFFWYFKKASLPAAIAYIIGIIAIVFL
jgi:Na+/H+ antiporter NhaD/arsenite permease-like protein